MGLCRWVRESQEKVLEMSLLKLKQRVKVETGVEVDERELCSSLGGVVVSL